LAFVVNRQLLQQPTPQRGWCADDMPAVPKMTWHTEDEFKPSHANSDSVTRRQILFSMLASASAVSPIIMLGRPGPASAADADATTGTGAATATATKSYPSATTNIMKPPLDERDYEFFTLTNGLRVLLCSDPTSNEAAVAMDVHVGACSDPPEIPGLAHFHEHMLFLGTKEYPKEDSFEAFLAQNGGSSNAYSRFGKQFIISVW
jgi:hypothetical protein